MKYSPSKFVFYPDELIYASPPSDLIDVSEADYKLAMNREIGSEIVVSDGGISIIPKSAPPEEYFAWIAKKKSLQLLSDAAIVIAPLQDSVDLGEATSEDTSLLDQWKRYRIEISKISEQQGYPNDIVWPTNPGD